MTEHVLSQLDQAEFSDRFTALHSARGCLRDFAEPFARGVLGDQYIDDTTGWLGWDVTPVYTDDVLTALDFVAIIDDDRGPGSRVPTRVKFHNPARPDFLDRIDQTALNAARDLCADSGDHNPEYVRACAEMLIDTSYGRINNDEHKDDLIAWLGAPL